MANVSTWEFIVGFLYILGGLGIFLFGMRVMSEGIQKVAGEGMRRIMATMTQNRFFGLARVCWSLAWFNRLQLLPSWW